MTDKEPSPSEKVWGSRGTTAKAEQENAARVALLDEEGELTDGFVRALAQTFVRFSSQAKSDGKAAASETGKAGDTERLAKMVLSEAELDEFARSVNGGAVMSTEEKEEVRQYFDVDQTGNLTVSKQGCNSPEERKSLC